MQRQYGGVAGIKGQFRRLLVIFGCTQGPRHEQLNRFEQHTKHCQTCSQKLQSTERCEILLFSLFVLVLQKEHAQSEIFSFLLLNNACCSPTGWQLRRLQGQSC